MASSFFHGDLEVFIDKHLAAKKGAREKRKEDGLLKKLIYKILGEKYQSRSRWEKKQM